jgi:predicted RNase H-like nuclease (RuvC/YqgF family)
MPYSLKQAADATGRTKPAILRAVQTGKISARKSEMGEWEIEPADLHRVYRPVTRGVTSTVTLDAPDTSVEIMLLRAELAAKDERLDLLQEERERERRQLSERITELRDQLARSEEERREKDRQLTALLTDQSGRGEKEVVVPDDSLPLRLRFFKYLQLWRH